MAARKEAAKLEKHSIGGGIATLEFALRPGRATVSRWDPLGEAYRLLILSGEALPTGMLLRGIICSSAPISRAPGNQPHHRARY